MASTSGGVWLEVLTKLGGAAGLLMLVVAATWKAFQALSGKWLDRRLAESLKRIEQQHDVMVRHLQSSIDREFDRAVKLQSKEFDSLAEGWSVLHEAYWRARESTGRGYELPDFSGMGAGQAEEFIDRLDFPNWRKQELRNLTEAADRQHLYVRAWRAKQYADRFGLRTELIKVSGQPHHP